MLKKENKNQKGITLISLVITIILLLILATVAIGLAVDSDGLFGKAGESANKWNTSVAEEETQLKDLIDKLDSYEGKVDWEAILEDAAANPDKYKHPDQSSTNGDIGIGTDGKPVNMDLWVYSVLADGYLTLNGEMLGSSFWYPGYANENIIDGKIQGTVPQYIKLTGQDEFWTVVGMMTTFGMCDKLVEAPQIPDTVILLEGTFMMCTSLTQAPVIPNSVMNMNMTFALCTSLTKVLDIPDSVTMMKSTFEGCTNLREAPEISNSVIDMTCTFRNCTSLITAPAIPDKVEDMLSTFLDCINLTTAPKIPGSVINMENTFSGCTNLRGIIEINATPNKYTNCFRGASTAEGEDVKLYVTGSSGKLDEIIATKSENSKIEK